MVEYIEREKVMDALLHEQYGYLCEDAINAIPAADVRENKRGKWIYRGQKVIDDLYPTYGCSVCGRAIQASLLTRCNYCPSCGAYLGEEQT